MTARLVSKVARLACPSALKNVRSLQAPRQHLAALSSPSFSSAVLTQTTSRQHRTESTPPRTAGVHSSHLGSLATSTTSSLLSTTHRYSSSSSGSSLPSSAGNSSTKPSPSGKTVGSDNSSDTSTDPTKDSSSGSSKDNSGDDNTAGGGGRRAGGNEDGRGRGPLTWGAVAFLGVAGALAVGYYRMKWDEKQKQVSSEVTSTGKPALGGPFTLVNMHGQPVTDKDFHGSFVMLYFGFCHCPDICPAELVKLGAIVEKLASKLGKGVVKPVFISVDPDRDSLAQLRYYAQDFHPSIEYLTGTKDQVAKAAKAYRVYFSKTEEHDEDEDYLVDHSIVIYLLAPDGEFLDFFTQRTTIADCVERTRKLAKGFKVKAS